MINYLCVLCETERADLGQRSCDLRSPLKQGSLGSNLIFIETLTVVVHVFLFSPDLMMMKQNWIWKKTTGSYYKQEKYWFLNLSLYLWSFQFLFQVNLFFFQDQKCTCCNVAHTPLILQILPVHRGFIQYIYTHLISCLGPNVITTGTRCGPRAWV